MINTENIIVVGDRVLIKPEDNLQKTNSGLYLPPGVIEKEKVQGGYIVKVGPGYPVAGSSEDDEPWKEDRAAKYIPLQAKPGDFALYLKKDSVDIEFRKEKLVIVPQAAILLLHRDDFI
ncbi:MAG: co-chaperone GroES [Ignavibacteriae bacterium]|nr:co-chaperone GroES [Ignavibacteriota bacterium]NOG98027.1 co-chaperone GroES [Ignavibacteriota bacterium]